MKRKTGSFVWNKRCIGLIISIVILVIVFIGITIFIKRVDSRIRSDDGVLDLQNWDFEENGILSLNGGWNFYWKNLLSYDEVALEDSKPDISAEVPNAWNFYKIKGRKLPGFGYATYVLEVVHATPGVKLALRIPNFSTSYELYINNQLLSSNGVVGTNKEEAAPEYYPEVVEFTPESSSFYMIIHISNYTYNRGGMWYSISMGTPAQINQMHTAISDKDIFLFGALCVLAFYYMSMFLLRREDKSSLYFVLMCFILACRAIIIDNFLIYKLIPGISYRTIVQIEYFTLIMFPVCAAYMVSQLFPEESSLKAIKISFLYAVGVIVILLLTPVSFFTSLIYFLQVLAMLISGYSIVIICKAFIKGKKDSFNMLLGSLVVILFGLHDMFFQNSLIQSNVGEWVSFGLFILLLFQSFVLSRRFSAAFNEVHSLSQKLLSLDKIKDEFLANTSHELRTPLNGILGITEAMLRNEEDTLNQQQRQNLSIIAENSRRLTNLVNDILDYSKMKNGDIRLNLKSIQIEGFIYTVVSVFQQLIKTMEYKIITDLPDTLPPVRADENRIVQILYNLIGNAAKFTERGYIKISAKRMEDMVEICVSDTGEGIPKDKLEDVFKSFEQVDTSLTRRHGGTGLGLAITKRLVELQGGTIWVESILGEGSNFYFTVPVSEIAETAIKSEVIVPDYAVTLQDETEEAVDLTDRARILLVDDDMVNLQAAKAILKLGGYSVITANSGKKALKEIESHPDYALVILDVMMPEISGYEVCKILREGKSLFELPILMLTAKTSAEDIVMGFETGANDYLPKPYEPEELLARVKTLVNLKLSVDNTMAAEIAFMQAQIKPHFLFNTLNAISSFCDTDPIRAQRLIDDFSNYLRQSFDFKDPKMYVTLEQELSMVRSYVEIEKARFGDKFSLELKIDVPLSSRIPVLSLQPLIENAINHGVRKKRGKGIVTLSVEAVDHELVISVEDDGQGIPEDKLEVLLEKNTGRGIGLWNIDQRLKKLYGKGLTINSTYGIGTKVSYTITKEMN